LISIPDSITITRHQEREAELYVKGREWLSKDERTPGIHASGLLDPLQAYWSTIDPLPLSDRLVTMFLVGKVLHAFVLGSYSGDVDIDSSDGGSSTSGLGYDYSPDLLHNGVVRELKTSRSYYEPKDLKDVSMYVEQLLTYMAATNTTESELWVLYLNLKDKETKKTTPAFRCYTVVLSQADLDQTKTELQLSARQLSEALKAKDPTGLPLCRTWKCGAKNCDWYDQCQPKGRYGTRQFDAAAIEEPA
jgi:hypothetical protein